MSATGKTTNYNLPIYQPNDTTSYLVDFNGAMTEIDSAIYSAQSDADSANTKFDNLTVSVENINDTLVNVQSEVITVRNNGTANTQAINLLQTHTNEQDVLIEKNASDISELKNITSETKHIYDVEVLAKSYFNTGSFTPNTISTSSGLYEFSAYKITDVVNKNGVGYGRKTLRVNAKGTISTPQAPIRMTLPLEYAPTFSKYSQYDTLSYLCIANIYKNGVMVGVQTSAYIDGDDLVILIDCLDRNPGFSGLSDNATLNLDVSIVGRESLEG